MKDAYTTDTRNPQMIHMSVSLQIFGFWLQFNYTSFTTLLIAKRQMVLYFVSVFCYWGLIILMSEANCPHTI